MIVKYCVLFYCYCVISTLLVYPNLASVSPYHIDDTLNVWQPPNQEKEFDQKQIDDLILDMNSYSIDNQFFLDNPSHKPL